MFRPGMTVREAKWAQCNWPHAIMSWEYERALTQLILAWRPWIAERAAYLAGENEQLKDELEQCAMIELWCLGVLRLEWEDRALIATILRGHMKDALRAEVRSIARNGDRLLPFI